MTEILAFYPSNKRSVQLETTILAMQRRGARVRFLTTCAPGPLHDYLSARGIRVSAHPVGKRWSLIYYVRQILHLARFCRTNDVTCVFSNLQHANFIAVFAQFLMPARVVVFRHHFKFALPGDRIPLKPNPMERLFDRVINRLGRIIVVPSSGVYEGMRLVERADMSRVRILPYIYDFDQYGQPDPAAVAELRSRYAARLILLMSARLIPFKRHALAFSVVRDLIEEGLDIRMLVLDDGPERASLEESVRGNRLEDRIVFLGYRDDFINYMAASDLLVHPSLTEASSSVVKEMALLGKTSIVCQGVGDFDEYLRHQENAFLVPRSTDGSEIAEILRSVYASPGELDRLGASLRQTVLKRFSVRPERVDRYLELVQGASPH
jgi:glycosyltransferase involved in cell wall biosynthesis